MFLQSIILFLSLLSVSVNALPTVPDVGATWAADWSAKRLDHLLSLYAPDAIFFTSRGDRIVGQPAIRKFFQNAMAEGSSTIHLQRGVTERSENLAYESGDYEETVTGAGNRLDVAGRYLLVLRNQKGHWLIVEQMWTGGGVGSPQSGPQRLGVHFGRA